MGQVSDRRDSVEDKVRWRGKEEVLESPGKQVWQHTSVGRIFSSRVGGRIGNFYSLPSEVSTTSQSVFHPSSPKGTDEFV